MSPVRFALALVYLVQLAATLWALRADEAELRHHQTHAAVGCDYLAGTMQGIHQLRDRAARLRERIQGCLQ